MKTRILLAMLLMCGVVFSACNSADNSAKEVFDKSAIVMGYEKNYLPMGFVDDTGIYTGFDIDLAKEISKRLINASGVSATLNVVPVDSEAAISGIEDGSLDFLGNSLSVAIQEQDKMIKTDPLFENDQVLVVNNDSEFNNASDMTGKKIAVVSGSLAEVTVSTDAFIKLNADAVDSDNIKAAFDMLKNKEVDAILTDNTAAKYFMMQGESVRILEDVLKKDGYCLLFNKNAKDLRDKVESILEELKKDGTLEEISVKWFGESLIK